MLDYTIYAGNNLIYNRNIVNADGELPYLVFEPTLNETTEEFCSLTYRCEKGSPAYSYSAEIKTRIKVYENGNLYWTGRVLKSTPTIDAEKEVYVEDFLGVLCDGIYRPFPSYNGTVADFLEDIVSVNNSQVGEDQQIYDVVCDITDNIVRSSEGYNTCWQIIKQKLLDMIGGYMWIEYDSQERAILHYSMSARNDSTQKIAFGSNLADYKVDFNFDGFYTACVPLGAKDQTTKEYVTIKSVNDDKDYLIDTANAAEYGIIYAPTSETTWEDVHEPSILLTRAQSWLQNKAARLIKEISLSAHDLSGLGNNVSAFKWLDSVYVEADEINDWFVIKNLQRRLDAPLQIGITMGDSKSSLTGSSVTNQNSTTQRIEIIESDYALNETLVNTAQTINQSIETLASSIYNTAEGIIMSAMANYVETGDFESFERDVRAQFTELSNSIEARVTEVVTQSITDNNTGYVTTKINEIYAFIKLVGTGVVIGTSDTTVKMKLVGDTLFFYTVADDMVTTENALAYFSSEQLVVNNSRIEVLSVGYGDSYMHFSVVGTGSLQCLFLSPRRIDS